MDETNISREVNMNNNGRESLCRAVEKIWGKAVNNRRDFEMLSQSVFRRTGKLLSPTTLKRIWGYLDEQQEHRRSTPDILAYYCGWHNYAAFEAGNDPEAESGPIGSTVLEAVKDMHLGDRVRLLWQPGRLCEVVYLGEGQWEVERAEATRLLPGDRFTCLVIAEGEPLYLENLRRGETQLGLYVCGRSHGVRFTRL